MLVRVGRVRTYCPAIPCVRARPARQEAACSREDAVPDQNEPTVTERLLALWEHIGIGAAHVAAQMPGDIAGLAREHPERIAGLVLCAPSRLDAAPFAGLASRLLMVAGSQGLTFEAT